MYASGRQRDEDFANGFLSIVREHTDCIPETLQSFHRPVSYLESPYGKIEGDLGFVIDINKQKTLVIVEREGSFPGNERNLLKWHYAIDSGQDIFLKREETIFPISTFTIIICLAFCTPKGSSEADFLKTYAFCGILANLLEEHYRGSGKILSIDIEKFDSRVTSWVDCGKYFGKKFIDVSL